MADPAPGPDQATGPAGATTMADPAPEPYQVRGPAGATIMATSAKNPDDATSPITDGATLLAALARPVLAPDPIRFNYHSMLVTGLMSSYNPLLKRQNEYLLRIVSNISPHEIDLLITGAGAAGPFSEAMEIVEDEIPFAVPPRGCSYRFVMRIFFQAGGRNGFTHIYRTRRENFVAEIFEAQNNLCPVMTRIFARSTRP